MSNWYSPAISTWPTLQLALALKLRSSNVSALSLYLTLEDRVRASTLVEADVELVALEFLSRYSAKGHSPMCGNSIGQDRRFMARHMPTLEGFFHYRNLDVSTLKELCRRWQPEVYKGFK